MGEKGIIVKVLKEDIAGNTLLCGCDIEDGLPKDFEKDLIV